VSTPMEFLTKTMVPFSPGLPFRSVSMLVLKFSFELTPRSVPSQVLFSSVV